MDLNKRELKKIRKNLPKEGKERLIIETQKSESTVEKVLLGLRNNRSVLLLAIELTLIPDEVKREFREKVYQN